MSVPEPSPKPKVFLTHSWNDIAFTRRLYADLKSHDLEVWYDEEGMAAGDFIAQEVDRGLKWCDYYMPILSRAMLTSSWCWEEINGAIALSNHRGKERRLRIISVLIENCENDMPVLLMSRIYVSFAGRAYDDSLKELLKKGFGIVNPPAPSPTTLSAERMP